MEKEKDVTLLTELEAFCRDLSSEFKNGAIIGLIGNLGTGKTTFVKVFVNIVTQKTIKVISPSFVIHQSYNIRPPIEHFDFYRLDNLSFSDLTELGYYERCDFCKNEHGFLFVEWPDKVSDIELLNLEYMMKFNFKAGKRWISLHKLHEVL